MISLKNVSFSYGQEDGGLILKDITLNISRGQVVVICGESGCGKTTLIRLINGLIPNYYAGSLRGSVLVNGMNVSTAKLYDTSKIIGSVFQNPKSQFFNVDTSSELAFASENQGLDEEEITRRMERAVRDFDMHGLMGRNIFKLSGGEKQKIACASVSVACPEVMVLDEPSSNLDYEAVEDLKRCIEQWKSQGKTIVISEHRLHYLKEVADRYIYMKDGGIFKEYTPFEMQSMSFEVLSEKGLRALVRDQLKSKVCTMVGQDDIQFRNFNFSYDKGNSVLGLNDFCVPRSSVTAVIGANGAGKSTFAKCLCGLQRKFKGQVCIDGEKWTNRDLIKNVFMVMQDSGHQLFTEMVEDEISLSLDRIDRDCGKKHEKVSEILQSLDLEAYRDRHPMSLSGGQKQRLAVGSAIASSRKIIVFDEPTSGLDYKHMKQVSEIIHRLREEGRTVLVITHDLEFIIECCDHVMQIDGGKLKKCFPVDEKKGSELETYFNCYTKCVG